MATARSRGESVEMTIARIERGSIEFAVLGSTPLIINRMSQKAKMELLAPRGRRTSAERQGTLKHDPVQEYRDSLYMLRDRRDAVVGMPSLNFKLAMATAALDTPGATKAKIERLVYVPGEFTPIFGVPKLFMAITRSADINKTPDVRTRAILPEWAATVTIEFVKPNLQEASMANLLVAAGFMCGIGDWRQEKGSGNYGSFEIVDRDNPDFKRIMKTQGRAAQIPAIQNAEPYNEETAELLTWFERDIRPKGLKADARGFLPTSTTFVGEVPGRAKVPAPEFAKADRKRANGKGATA